ncbi:bifunctional folylpolyglutamate synthase/dihydrofolate synthase [Companilactobacillus jidongensis]|uniref:bifunctional folylpolyglutamate synthase/dihydrofolate synthase n=1 Tax=Companilactobacillus jidongensis TaxID=2486006 RepID=UPI000F78B66D|nr:folylpolyglutamate synthase/dihydrofolate synthase family protein [Companilactobacillus jidongensis]
MIRTGEEAVAWIHTRRKFGSRPGLDRIEALLKMLGNPEDDVKSIHIAGTNGKGSTVMYLRCMLEELDLTVGTFTSPYIETFYERIAVNGQPIPEADFVELVNVFMPLIEKLDADEHLQGITEFEILTGMAFYYFKDRVDIAIIEAGIGGLMDSTNVVHPMLAAITTVGLDHVDILGDTLEKIAQQKSGIIKKHIPIVAGDIPENALAVIRNQAVQTKAPFYSENKDFLVDYIGFDKNRNERFNFRNHQFYLKDLRIPLKGRHQTENAGVALELFSLHCQHESIRVNENHIREGLKKVRWPARMETVSESPLIIMDGAHNPHAMRRLTDNMVHGFADTHIHVLFSAITTKNIDEMLNMLQQVPNIKITITTFDFPSSLNVEDYAGLDNIDGITIVDDWHKGLNNIKSEMISDDVLFITGSLYFISQVRDEMKKVH